MKIALVNPCWDFTGSIYFGCREPHLPLELGYSQALLDRAGHAAEIFDGHIADIGNGELADAVAAFAPDMTVVTTAPTYLFWRCPPPELRVPADFIARLGGRGGRIVAVGPHGSTTPRAALRKLKADLVVRGECEEVVLALAEAADVRTVASTAYFQNGDAVVNGPPAASRFVDHPALRWPSEWIARHRHHHHRFDGVEGPGAEVEASRGCPYSCTFCAKLDFRDKYRRRDLAILLDEIDGLVADGARYIYFVDEIFLPQDELLEALAERPVEIGIQTRIDIWKPHQIELLGAAGCVSVEAGVESLSVEGRAALNKRCKLDNEELADLLIATRQQVPFVQANLIGTDADSPAEIERWRARLMQAGVWANEPVPLYPYPASPDYRRLFGELDERAWERAHEHYLAVFDRFSDIQEDSPVSLHELEAECSR